MIRSSVRTSWLVVLAGCGRLGFDSFGSAATGGDGPRMGDGPSVADAAVIPPGAKIWLRMETDAGQTIVDSAGGHTSTCVATCPTHTPAGRHGGAFQFMMDEVDVTDAVDLDSSAGFTGAIWFRIEVLPSALVCPWTKPFNNASGYDTFAICIHPDGSTNYDAETPTGTTISEDGPVLPTGNWHHAAITWDGTTKRDYLDGVEVANATAQLGAGTENMMLGAARNSYYLNGYVDDALYYTRALTLAEIQQLATP